MSQLATLQEENKRLQIRVTTLEQLLLVQEQTVLEQSGNLEKTLDQLREYTKELETLNQVMLDREERVLELKLEVNKLLEKLNQPTRYTV